MSRLVLVYLFRGVCLEIRFSGQHAALSLPLSFVFLSSLFSSFHVLTTSQLAISVSPPRLPFALDELRLVMSRLGIALQFDFNYIADSKENHECVGFIQRPSQGTTAVVRARLNRHGMQ